MELRQIEIAVDGEYGPALRGRLVYVADEYSFAYRDVDQHQVMERAGSEGTTSLVADTVQLEVGVESGRLLYAWGYLPASSWRDVAVGEPDAAPAGLRVVDLGQLEPGISLPISADDADWQALFDRTTGWLKVAVQGTPPEDRAYHIATGVAVGLRENRITSIWLHPDLTA